MPVEAPEDLYGLPLDRFIPERAALAKFLRAEKRRDEAAEVAAMRKPSVAAWAVNQLVRTQANTVELLFAAGDDLARAQFDAAAGKRSGDAMREAARRQREALDELVQAATGLLTSEGQALSQTTLERVRDTLLAAAIDEDARQQVQTGCLTHELQFAGLGVFGQSSPWAAPPPKPGKRPKKTAPGDTKADGDAEADTDTARASEAQEKEQQKENERERKEAERQRRSALTAARHTEADARRAMTRAEKGLAAAQAKRDDAAAALQEAERLVAEAEQRAEERAAELTRAERALKELRDT